MKEKIKKWIMANLGYKILALFIAFFLWFYVIGEKVAERVYRLPIVFQNITRDLIIEPRTSKVHITLKGTRNLVMNYNPENFYVFKDLKNYTPGKYSIPVSLEDIPLDDEEVEIVRIEPESIDIEIRVQEERIVRFKNFPIKILESPASFHRISLETTKVYLEVAKTEEYAPKLDMAEIMVILDISELKEGTYQLPLQTKFPQGVTLVTIKPAVVKVTLKAISPLIGK